MFSSLSVFIGICIAIDVIDGIGLLYVITTTHWGLSVIGAVIIFIFPVSLGLTTIALCKKDERRMLEPEVSKSHIELISVANGTQVHGSGSFSCFLLSSSDTYRYYYKADNGYIEQSSTPVCKSHIAYTNEKPYLEIVETTSVLEAKFLVFKDCETKVTTEYIYHIPEGSVVTNYELR